MGRTNGRIARENGFRCREGLWGKAALEGQRTTQCRGGGPGTWMCLHTTGDQREPGGLLSSLFHLLTIPPQHCQSCSALKASVGPCPWSKPKGRYTKPPRGFPLSCVLSRNTNLSGQRRQFQESRQAMSFKQCLSEELAHCRCPGRGL